MPANMKKAGIKYKKGGSKKMKKARRGTGRIPKADLGMDIGNWIHRAVDNTKGFVGNVARDLSDPFVAGLDWLGDADRSWIPGTKDLWNIRPDDYNYSQRGWNKPGWKAGSAQAAADAANTADPRQGRSVRNRQKWASEEAYVPQSQRRSRGGVIAPGKFLRTGGETGNTRTGILVKGPTGHKRR